SAELACRAAIETARPGPGDRTRPRRDQQQHASRWSEPHPATPPELERRAPVLPGSLFRGMNSNTLAILGPVEFQPCDLRKRGRVCWNRGERIHDPRLRCQPRELG